MVTNMSELENLGTHVPSADIVEQIVRRNADWAARFITRMALGLLKDGRPLFTTRIPPKERLERLLQAPRPFWEALSERDPETAAAMVAEIIRARSRGQLAMTGPRVYEVDERDMSPFADKYRTDIAQEVLGRVSREALRGEGMTTQ
jgi:hypothetical protein